MSFPEHGRSDYPGNRCNIFGWIFQDLPIRLDIHVLLMGGNTLKCHIQRNVQIGFEIFWLVTLRNWNNSYPLVVHIRHWVAYVWYMHVMSLKTHIFAHFHQKYYFPWLPGTESMTKFSSFVISSLDLAFSLYGFGRNSLTDFRDCRFDRGLVTTKCS